jgi:hypothetical protein
MRTTLRPLAAVLSIAVLGLACTGCGSGADDGGTTDPGTSSPGTSAKPGSQEQAVRFSACMRRNGVADFPDPNPKGDFDYGVSVTPEVFTKATTACKALQPPGSLSSKRTPKEQASSLRFAACVRRHGVRDFPDPVEGEPVINTYKIPSSNRPGGMAILNAATDACRSLSGIDTGGKR